jgi:hypothetical protein
MEENQEEANKKGDGGEEQHNNQLPIQDIS